MNGQTASPTKLVEHIDDWRTDGLVIERERRLIRNVALTGRESKNGYRYTEQALETAVALYESKPVFLDHAVDVSRPHERSARDLVGSIVEARYHDGRIRGDIRVVDTEAGRTFLALAESSGPAVGMSHVVLAERNADESVVERIHDVISVDAVAFPATTSTFRESRQDGSTVVPGSFESILDAIDADLESHIRKSSETEIETTRRIACFSTHVIAEVFEANGKTLLAIPWTYHEHGVEFGSETRSISGTELREFAVDDRNHAEVIAERNRLQTTVDELEAEQRERDRHQRVERMLAEARLPVDVVTELFRTQLLEAADDDSRRTLIAERRRIVESCSSRSPESSERGTPSTASDDTQIIAAIRRGSPSALAGVG